MFSVKGFSWSAPGDTRHSSLPVRESCTTACFSLSALPTTTTGPAMVSLASGWSESFHDGLSVLLAEPLFPPSPLPLSGSICGTAITVDTETTPNSPRSTVRR
ncbi:hypothetical protein GCM10010302_16670 [Streptomyces polychromogenes]|uniref:Uncharacterized protein n=1 Tax=Streptomyces polychromogenes TaxID=67342 RepID=A0ABP3EUN4_9ACTN